METGRRKNKFTLYLRLVTTIKSFCEVCSQWLTMTRLSLRLCRRRFNNNDKTHQNDKRKPCLHQQRDLLGLYITWLVFG